MIRKFNIDYFNFVKVSIIQIIIMVGKFNFDYFRFFKVSFIQFIIVTVAITVITNY